MPVEDMGGCDRQSRVMRWKGMEELKLCDRKNTSRTTVLSVVSADSEAVPPMFVFEGKGLPYQNILVDGKIVQQTYSSYLQRSAMLTMREDIPCVGCINFMSWA